MKLLLNVSADEAVVLDASGGEADASFEKLDVLVAPLNHVLSLDDDCS